jgi:hypothetical protein
MKIKRFFIKVYQSLLDYDILKIISEQLRLLAWASPAVWLWFGWYGKNKLITAAAIFVLWFGWQGLSLLILKLAKKFKEVS